MQAKKSFFEILSSTWSTFKSSFWGIMATWWFAIVVTVAIYWIIGHIFNIQISAFDPKQFQNTPLSAPEIILVIFNLYIAILLFTWQVLVIKNNAFTGVNNLFAALKKAFSKSLKALAILAILLPIFVIAVIIATKIFPPCAKIIPAIFWFLFVPLAMVPLGVILHDTKFINAVTEAFGICFSHYFRILGFFILLFIMQLILIVLLGIIIFVFRFLVILFLAVIVILAVLLYLTIYPFYTCFFVELYLDLATDVDKFLDNTSSQEESYPEIINLDLPQEQTPTEQTQPKEDQPQKIYPDEPPEGLQELGGNYGDKK